MTPQEAHPKRVEEHRVRIEAFFDRIEKLPGDEWHEEFRSLSPEMKALYWRRKAKETSPNV